MNRHLRHLFRALRQGWRAFRTFWAAKPIETTTGQRPVGFGHRRPFARESGSATPRGPGRDGLALETPGLRRIPCSPTPVSTGSGGDPAPYYSGPVRVPAADGRTEIIRWVQDGEELERLGEWHVRVAEICTQRGGFC